MNPSGNMVPITEDDQGEGYADVFSLEELEDTLEREQIKLEKFRRRKEQKNISKL